MEGVRYRVAATPECRQRLISHKASDGDNRGGAVVSVCLCGQALRSWSILVTKVNNGGNYGFYFLTTLGNCIPGFGAYIYLAQQHGE